MATILYKECSNYFFDWKLLHLYKDLLTFVPTYPIDSKLSFLKLRAWHRLGDKPYVNQWWPSVLGCVLLCCSIKRGCSWTRYAKLRVAHAPRMPGTFSPSPRVSDPDMQHGTCVMLWCMTRSLISGLLWSRWRGKRPGIPSACATRNFAHLVRGPYSLQSYCTCIGAITRLPPILVKQSCLGFDTFVQIWWLFDSCVHSYRENDH